MKSRDGAAFCLAWALVAPSLAMGQVKDVQAAEVTARFTVGADGRSIEMVDFPNLGTRSSCQVNQRIQRTRLTHDRKGVLVLPHGYVTVQDLRTCNSKQVSVRMNPQEGGEIEDIHFTAGLYIGLLPVGTQPLSYLAVISRLGENKNLFRLAGSYPEGNLTDQALRQSFTYDADANVPTFAKFSPDGRYVSPGGEPDCSADAHPGVWDLKTRKKVVLQGDTASSNIQCRKLFE